MTAVIMSISPQTEVNDHPVNLGITCGAVVESPVVVDSGINGTNQYLPKCVTMPSDTDLIHYSNISHPLGFKPGPPSAEWVQSIRL